MIMIRITLPIAILALFMLRSSASQTKDPPKNADLFVIDDLDATDEEISRRQVPVQAKRFDLCLSNAGKMTIRMLRDRRQFEEVILGPEFSNDGLTELGKAAALRRLTIIDNFKCTDDGGAKLTQLHALDRLVLICPNMSDRTLVAITHCTHLQHLMFAGTVTDVGLRELGALTELTELHLTKVRPSKKIETLGLLTNLRAMTLRGRIKTDKGLASQFKDLRKLERIELSLSGLEDAAISEIVRTATAKEIDLTGAETGHRTIAAIGERKTLKRVTIHRARISPEEEKSLRVGNRTLELVIQDD